MSESESAHLRELLRQKQAELDELKAKVIPDRATFSKLPPEIAEAKVLDHGYVKYIRHSGDDLSALEAARMSTKNPTGVDEKKDNGLRNRLWRDRHTSPFEMSDLTLEFQLPVFALRQIDRHRTLDYPGETDLAVESVDEIIRQFMSRNEFSGRYSVMEDLFYTPSTDRILGKDPTNKQGSMGPLPPDVQERAVSLIKESRDKSWEVYAELVRMGVANEVARVVLQMAQYTRLQLKGSALSWLKFFDLRLRHDVQWETRQFTQAAARIFRAIWPRTWDVFEENTLYAQTFSRSELATLREMLRGYEKTFADHQPEDEALFQKVIYKATPVLLD